MRSSPHLLTLFCDITFLCCIVIFQTLFVIVLAFITPLLPTLSFLTALSILTTPRPSKLLYTSTISPPPTPFLSHGFPLGPMPPLRKSVIIKNHSSVDRFPALVGQYISSEIALCRMSGPFSLSDTERILRGPIYCSPFIVDEQDQGPGVPPKYRVCRNLSKDDPISGMGSVNSFISKEDFPTRFDMACHVAEAVSCSSVSSCSS
jgi:hypothetical protein